MAVRVARALAAAGAEPVLAIGGDGDALERLGMAWQPDRFPGEGPLGGLLTAFGALSEARARRGGRHRSSCAHGADRVGVGRRARATMTWPSP